MAITEGTQPAPVQWTGTWTTAQTTASFTPESGALLVALVSGDGSSPGTTTAAVSDSIDGTAQWVLLRRQNSVITGVGGTCEVWCRDSPGTSMTVSVTGSGNPLGGGQLAVRTLIGAVAKASQNGAVNGATLSAAAVQVSVAAGTGNRVYGAAFNYDTSTAMTALANTTATGLQFSDSTNGDSWEAFKSSGDTAGTATYGYSTAHNGMIAAAEIKAASGGAPFTATPGSADGAGAAYDAVPQIGAATSALFAGSATGISGSWSTTANATGSTQGTYATWTDSAAGSSAVLELATFGADAAVPAGSTVQSVTCTVRHGEAPSSAVASVTAQAYSGTTPVGSAQPLSPADAVHDDTVTFTGLAYADLADLRVRVTVTRT